jgi:hypothetical protein
MKHSIRQSATAAETAAAFDDKNALQVGTASV